MEQYTNTFDGFDQQVHPISILPEYNFPELILPR
jgi:hypothetical protein